MDETADPCDVPDVIPRRGEALDENVAGEQRFGGSYHPATGGAFHPESRIEHFQTQIPVHIRRSNVFMLRLCPGAVPCLIKLSPHTYSNASL
jgi:hypothetical protein